MTDEELHDLAAAYAVDAVDDAEREAFEAHLPACAPCRQVLAELTDVVVGLSDGLEVDPPRALRDRVLSQVAAESSAGMRTGSAVSTPEQDDTVVPLSRATDRRHRESPTRGSRRSWLLAAAAAVVVGVGAWGVSQSLAPDPLDQVMSADDASEHTAAETDGLVVITSASADQAVLRLPEDLPAPQAGTVYQAWFINAEGVARSAGVLSAESLKDGSGLLEGSFSGATAVGLTVEPEGGSEQPTTQPFAVIPLT